MGYRRALLGLIILVGLALRLAGVYWGQAYSYFEQGDGIEAYSVAVDYGGGDSRAQYIGQPNYNSYSKVPGPLWAVYCFLCLRYGGSIYGVVWGTLLLNTLFVYLVFVLAESTLNRKAAYWAALLTATSPWAVYYSVGVYNPNIMGFLGVLVSLAAWWTLQRDRSKLVAFIPLLLLAMPQVHMSGLMLVPAVVLVLLAGRARLNVPWLCLGLAGGLVLYLPYIRGEMASGWQNTHGMFSGDSKYSWSCLKALTTPLGFLVNWVPQWPGKMSLYKEMARAYCGSFAVVLLLGFISALMAALILAGAFVKVKAAVRGNLRSPRAWFRNSPGIAFLALIVLVPLLFALFNGKGFHTRYFLVLLGPFLALAGAGASAWSEEGWPPVGGWRKVFPVATGITICANIWLVLSLYHFQSRQIEKGEAFIPTWEKLEIVYHGLKQKAGDEHSVQVDDSWYLANGGRTQDSLRGAAHIRTYVTVREKQALLVSGQRKPPVRFRLLKAGAATPGTVAYQAEGIMLVPDQPQ